MTVEDVARPLCHAQDSRRLPEMAERCRVLGDQARRRSVLPYESSSAFRFELYATMVFIRSSRSSRVGSAERLPPRGRRRRSGRLSLRRSAVSRAHGLDGIRVLALARCFTGSDSGMPMARSNALTIALVQNTARLAVRVSPYIRRGVSASAPPGSYCRTHGARNPVAGVDATIDNH